MSEATTKRLFAIACVVFLCLLCLPLLQDRRGTKFTVWTVQIVGLPACEDGMQIRMNVGHDVAETIVTLPAGKNECELITRLETGFSEGVLSSREIPDLMNVSVKVICTRDDGTAAKNEEFRLELSECRGPRTIRCNLVPVTR